MTPATRVLLLGMMGVGKSTVGRALSASTGWRYLDNDELVSQHARAATADVLAREGESALRRAESAALREVLGIPPPLVASVAAGVVLEVGNRRRLRTGGHVVWLRARLDTLAARVAAGPPRPWLGADPQQSLRLLYQGREALYREVAAQVVDVEGCSAAELAAGIVAALEG